MATTTGTPWNIAYPVVGDQVTPLQTIFGTLATSVHNALTKSQSTIFGTDAERIALTAPTKRAGLRFFATDTNLTWYSANATTNSWILEGDSGEVNVTFATGWSSLVQPTYRLKNGYVSLNGRVNATAGSGADTIFTLPTGYRPLTERVAMAMDGSNGLHTIIIGTSGAVQNFGRSTSARSDIRLATVAPFPVA